MGGATSTVSKPSVDNKSLDEAPMIALVHGTSTTFG